MKPPTTENEFPSSFRDRIIYGIVALVFFALSAAILGNLFIAKNLADFCKLLAPITGPDLARIVVFLGAIVGGGAMGLAGIGVLGMAFKKKK